MADQQIFRQGLLRRLERAKADTDINLLQFSYVAFDEILISVVLDLFRHDPSRRYKLDICDCEGVDDFLKFVLLRDIIVSVKIDYLGYGMDLSQECFQYLGLAMQSNLRLQELSLNSIQIGNTHAAMLSEGLASRYCQLKCLQLKGVNWLQLDAFTRLVDGLSQNTSLDTLVLEDAPMPYTRSDLAYASILIQGLKRRPSCLQTLDLTFWRWDEVSLQALSNLLTASNALETLGVKDVKDNIDTLLAGLRNNESLKHLDLSRSAFSSDETMENLGRACATHPSLETLVLQNTDITNHGLELFAHAIQSGCRQLRCLDLTTNERLTRDGAPWLLKIIQDHVGLRNVRCGDFWLESDQHLEIKHLLDFMRGGRMLLQDQGSCLGLWPLVLARVNTDAAIEQESKANVLYHLLRGRPERFCCRTVLGSPT